MRLVCLCVQMKADGFALNDSSDRERKPLEREHADDQHTNPAAQIRKGTPATCIHGAPPCSRSYRT